MTTSTDKATPTPKPKKPKGPIRWEAVIPALVFTALIAVYFHLFFDGHVRRMMEYVGTQVNGAEVNIGHLSTSFIRADLEIGDIQITDKEKPERNIIQVGKIHFKMLWDALLRAKVVVDDASILDIQALTPRKTKGYVVPPPPPSNEPSALEKAEKQVLDQTRKRYSQNFLGDIATVLGGTDPKEQLKNLQTQLKSDARIKQLEAELKDKKAKWDQRIKELPQGKELEQYNVRVKALKFDFNNPSELAKSVKEAETIIREVDQKVKLVQSTSKDVNGDINNYTQSFKDLEKMVQEDLRDLQGRLKIPDINPKEFSQQLFMSMIEKKLVGVRKYVELARKYMPPKKTAEEKAADQAEAVVPRQRGEGRNYRFPITTGYPLFWLKHAAISSELSSSEYGGNIKGEIKDLTTDPTFIRKPTLLLAQGDFPKQNIAGVDGKITIDHTTDKARELLNLKVGSFPVQETSLSDSDDVRLSLQGATGQSDISGSLENETISLSMRNSFGNVKYNLEAKNKIVREILDNVLKGIPTVTVNATITGSLSDFDVHINSNLGEELANGFKKQLQAKLDEAKAQLKQLIDGKIGAERNKLKAEMDKATGDVSKLLGSKQAEVDKVLKDAKDQVAANKGGKGQGEQKLKEEGKKLLKKFNLGG